MCDWFEMRGPDIRDVGPQATPAQIDRWYKESPASPDRMPKAGPLPGKARSMARAQLRERKGSDGELKWTGGRGGSQ
jgi:hypothetical protein